MQGRNPSTAIPDPDQKRKQRLRMLRNCTIVVLVVVLIVLAVNLVRYFTRSRSIGVYSLPCFAHQDVTVFRDGVVYYDGESIHCVGATGTVLWSYPVGSGASFSVSDKYLIAWSGTQLFIVNENGRPTYNEPMTSEIQFARIGNTRAVIVLGDEINPEVMMVDLNGQLLDSEKRRVRGQDAAGLRLLRHWRRVLLDVERGCVQPRAGDVPAHLPSEQNEHGQRQFGRPPRL